jgi:hypothetical protein
MGLLEFKQFSNQQKDLQHIYYISQIPLPALTNIVVSSVYCEEVCYLVPLGKKMPVIFPSLFVSFYKTIKLKTSYIITKR